MLRKIDSGECIDISTCEKTPDGDYILERFEEGIDYCDAKGEYWIWSIGRHYDTGQILASTSSKFYQNDAYECLFLR